MEKKSKNLCLCGCGEEVNKHKFKYGHRANIKRKLCACGCKKYATSGSIFIRGHNIKGHHYNMGHSVWSKGETKETNESLRRLSQKMMGHISLFKGKTLEEIFGSIKAEEIKDKNRKNNIGNINHNPNGFGKSGKRKDLNNQFFRSTWEANFARILNYIGIEWEYEICRFKFNDCSLLIDFYLPQFDMWVEVKGYFKDITFKQFNKMHLEYPNENVKILDGKGYKKLTKMFKLLIKEWE